MRDPSNYFLQQYFLEENRKQRRRLYVQFSFMFSFILGVVGFLFTNVSINTILLFEFVVLISIVLFTISSHRKAMERQETLFMMLELDPELLEQSNRMDVAFQAVQAGNLQSIQVSKTHRRNRGSDEKGFTPGRIDSQLKASQNRRDATSSDSIYKGLEDDLRPSEVLVNQANIRYQERADQLWQKAESEDTDLIEAGVERLGDLVKTDWFEKNAKQGAVQDLMDSQKQDEEI